MDINLYLDKNGEFSPEVTNLDEVLDLTKIEALADNIPSMTNVATRLTFITPSILSPVGFTQPVLLTTVEPTAMPPLSPDSRSSSYQPLGSMNIFLETSVSMCSTTQKTPCWLIDSGAAVSGTHDLGDISLRTECHVPITPAFGKDFVATTRGSINLPALIDLDVRVLHIAEMHHKLLSVFEVCNGGANNVQQVGIFTNEGCRFFPIDDCQQALQMLSQKQDTFFGKVDNGVYKYSPRSLH